MTRYNLVPERPILFILFFFYHKTYIHLLQIYVCIYNVYTPHFRYGQYNYILNTCVYIHIRNIINKLHNNK